MQSLSSYKSQYIKKFIIYPSIFISISMQEHDHQVNKRQQRVACFYAALNIGHSKISRLYSPEHAINERFHQYTSMFMTPQTQNINTEIVGELLGSFKHSVKKPNEKLVQMHFLKDSNFVVLGYDKQTERGDINFIAVNQLKNRDFYYNKLSTGVGGIQCFDDGRNILIADKKGVFSFIDMFKELNYNDIENKRINTDIDGVLDISLSPSQTKIVCGLSDKRCVVLDIEKQRRNRKFQLHKTFDRHLYSVNSVNWHPYKSLIVSSSIHLSDSIKLWDPHSEELVHQSKLHSSIVSKVMFHPEGNTYFSLGKDNSIAQNEIRKRGKVNTFKLQFQPTHLQVLKNNNVVVGDSGGYMNWFTPSGQLITRFNGASGVALFSIDQTNSILVIGREREHMFQIYTKKNALKIDF